MFNAVPGSSKDFVFFTYPFTDTEKPKTLIVPDVGPTTLPGAPLQLIQLNVADNRVKVFDPNNTVSTWCNHTTKSDEDAFPTCSDDSSGCSFGFPCCGDDDGCGLLRQNKLTLKSWDSWTPEAFHKASPIALVRRNGNLQLIGPDISAVSSYWPPVCAAGAAGQLKPPF